jgi:predicted RNase H-like nuclease
MATGAAKSMRSVVCIGLDLAWSSRNPSGGAVIVEGVLGESRADLGSDTEIIQWIGRHLSPGCAAVVAIDAPLRVPNETGQRACERELGAQWRRYQAGPYPANRKNLAVNGVVRGEALVEALAAHYGFVEAAPIISQPGGRFVCEVFPHPAHVSLFGLPQILKYKVKRRGQLEAYWQETTRYQTLLAGLAEADPPLRGAEALLAQPAAGLRGKKLKQLEDQLDAVTCAYVASYLWRHGQAGAWVYGTVADGHIVVPRFPPHSTESTLKLT